MLPFIDALAALGAAVLFIGGSCALLACLIVFTKALSGLAQARAQFATAAAQEEIVRVSREATDELDRHPSRRAEHEYPSAEELRRAAYEQTMDELGVEGEMPEHYPTVEDNALRYPNGQSEIEPDLLYERTPEA